MKKQIKNLADKAVNATNADDAAKYALAVKHLAAAEALLKALSK